MILLPLLVIGSWQTALWCITAKSVVWVRNNLFSFFFLCFPNALKTTKISPNFVFLRNKIKISWVRLLLFVYSLFNDCVVLASLYRNTCALTCPKDASFNKVCDQSSKFPRSQSNWASVGCAEQTILNSAGLTLDFKDLLLLF